jgi:hypothetical protein
LRLKDDPDPDRDRRSSRKWLCRAGPGRPGGIRVGGRMWLWGNVGRPTADPRLTWKFPQDWSRNMRTNSIRSTERCWSVSSKLPRKAQELALDSFHSVLYFTCWWWRGHICGARDPNILRKCTTAANEFQQGNLSARAPSHGAQTGESEMKGSAPEAKLEGSTWSRAGEDRQTGCATYEAHAGARYAVRSCLIYTDRAYVPRLLPS